MFVLYFLTESDGVNVFDSKAFGSDFIGRSAMLAWIEESVTSDPIEGRRLAGFVDHAQTGDRCEVVRDGEVVALVLLARVGTVPS